MTINVKTAVKNAQTYQELFSIARELHAELSFWGHQYATVATQSPLYEGTIVISAIAKKAMKIRKKREKKEEKQTELEKNSVFLLCREISRLYDEDKVNCAQANKMTTTCRVIINTIFLIHHQSKWNNIRNGSSYKEQLQKPVSIKINKLKQAIDKAQSYPELIAITEEMHAERYCRGYQYAHEPYSFFYS
jgi:hypothetical protein